MHRSIRNKGMDQTPLCIGKALDAAGPGLRDPMKRGQVDVENVGKDDAETTIYHWIGSIGPYGSRCVDSGYE
jgi:hypothetical protein